MLNQLIFEIYIRAQYVTGLWGFTRIKDEKNYYKFLRTIWRLRIKMATAKNGGKVQKIEMSKYFDIRACPDKYLRYKDSTIT